MLTLTIFLPFACGLGLLALPASRPRLVRGAALGAAAATLACAGILWSGYERAGASLQWRERLEWIPSIGASYDVAVDGVSLPLIALAALLLALVMLYTLHQRDRPKLHAFLFLVMATGLMGVFAARDLLLFYLFFEVALVPLYFIIGIWGEAERRYAAMKFFLYTRAGSLAMLLSFLGLYLAMRPHTFSLDAIIAARPLDSGGALPGLVLLGLLVGFGVKLPVVPLHNWLPDAHVEAPTEASVMLAGIQLKLGAYGFVAVLLPALPAAAARYGWWMLGLGIVTLVYGAFAALAQTDLKRLVAYTSINHMGYVLIGVAVAALTTDAATRALALNGAVLQAVSHGLLTGGMFFVAGMLGERAGTREIGRFGGLLRRVPVYSALLGVLAFASLGLPGFSGFAAEFQVIGATLSLSVAAAALIVLGLLVTTALYVRVLTHMVMGDERTPKAFGDLDAREIAVLLPLVLLSAAIGVAPAILMPFLR